MKRIIPVISIICIALVLPQDRDYPDFEIVVNNNPYPADIIIHMMSESQHRYMGIIDTDLSVKWYINSGPLGMDFKVNNNVLSYFHKPKTYWVIMDKNMQETDTLSCANNYNADYHDIRILESGNYILQAYGSRTVDMSEMIENGHPNCQIEGELILQEFNSYHELIFEWKAWDYLDITEYTNLDLTSEQITWMHGNSIEVDDDNYLIVSNRRSSEILKIHRYLGDIIWRFGGPQNDFTIVNDPLDGFSKQHDVRRLENGNITIFDNGNEHSPSISRVLEYQLDEVNKIATLVWEYIHPENYIGLAMGSAQRLDNGNTLINWGTMNGIGAVITEVDYEKNIVMEIIYPHVYHSYKVRKSNWDFDINLQVGDANLDDSVDILDIIYLVNEILYSDSDPSVFDLYKIDIDKDGSIDVTDIIQLVNIILAS